MRTILTILSFAIPAAIAGYLILAPAIAEHGEGNVPTGTGLLVAGVATVAGFAGAIAFNKLARRRR